MFYKYYERSQGGDLKIFVGCCILFFNRSCCGHKKNFKYYLDGVSPQQTIATKLHP